MKKLFVFTFLLLACACEDQPKDKPDNSRYVSLKKFQKEGMPSDSILINDKFSFFMNKNEAHELFPNLRMVDSLINCMYYFRKTGELKGGGVSIKVHLLLLCSMIVFFFQSSLI
jgi:hypothetical protein